MSAASVTYAVGSQAAISISDGSVVRLPDNQTVTIALAATTGIRRWTLRSSSGFSVDRYASSSLSEQIPRIAPATQETWTSSVWDGLKTVTSTFYLRGMDNTFWTPEEFGAKRDGVTSDTAAIQAAVDAAVAAGGGAVLLSAGTYLISGGPVSIASSTNGVSVRGLGDATILKNTSNTQTVQILGQDCTVENLRVQCTGSGVAQDGISNGPFGISSGPPRTRILNVTVEGAGRAGIFLAPNNVDVYQHDPLVQGCRVTGCQYGIWVQGEYHRVIGCDAWANTTGIYVPGGNNIIIGCTLTGNTTGLWMRGGGNDGHGIVSACDINHNTTNLYADGSLANGMPFVGCNFYGAGTSISLLSSVGIRFLSCAIDVADLYFDGSTGTQFQNCLWPVTAAANTLHHNYNGHASKTVFGAGNVTLDGLGDQLAYTFPADSNQTLTIAQSVKQVVVIAAGVVTLPRTITSALDATIGQRVLVRNNTAQTITWAWASGTGAAIPTGTAMWVGSDGTNAISLGAMT